MLSSGFAEKSRKYFLKQSARRVTAAAHMPRILCLQISRDRRIIIIIVRYIEMSSVFVKCNRTVIEL